MPTFNALIKPLQILFPVVGGSNGVEPLLRGLSTPSTPQVPQAPLTLATFIRREAECSIVDLQMAPDERFTLERLVWPLREAKVNYCIGNFVATLALCAMVGEMLAILHLEIHDGPSQGEKGKSVEETRDWMKQSMKIELLRSKGIITEEEEEWFRIIATTRNAYLHRKEQGMQTVEPDALRVYTATVSLVRLFLGSIKKGKWCFHPEYRAYLERHKVIQYEQQPL